MIMPQAALKKARTKNVEAKKDPSHEILLCV